MSNARSSVYEFCYFDCWGQGLDLSDLYLPYKQPSKLFTAEICWTNLCFITIIHISSCHYVCKVYAFYGTLTLEYYENMKKIRLRFNLPRVNACSLFQHIVLLFFPVFCKPGITALLLEVAGIASRILKLSWFLLPSHSLSMQSDFLNQQMKLWKCSNP